MGLIVEEAQRSTWDRLHLLMVEARLGALDTAAAAAWVAAGVLAFTLGWVLLVGSSTLVLSRHMDLWMSLACMGLSQLVLGIGLMVAGLRGHPPPGAPHVPR